MDHTHAALRPVLANFAVAAWKSLATFVRAQIAFDVRPYRPEAYYMRGPGPKWREKHAREANPS